MSSKWLAMFVLPVALILVVAAVYLRSQNRGLEAQMALLVQKNDILEGEVYRLKQEMSGKEARLDFINQPGMERFLAEGLDGTSSLWLFWRKADSTWYADVSNAAKPDQDMQLRLYAVANDAEDFIGSFEAFSESIGLQKVGQGGLSETLVVTEALRDEASNYGLEAVRYKLGYAY